MLFYVHSDYLGTPRTVATSSGQVVHQWKQSDLWGQNLPQISTIEYNLRFPGQYFDNETNLHYNIYRTYDPQIGRYLQPDPIGLASGETNLYNYVGNNTISKTDRLGLYALKKDFNSNLLFNSDKSKPGPLNALSSNILYKSGWLYTQSGTPVIAHKYMKNYNNFFTDVKFYANYEANCHGTTFAEGRYKIDDTQVYIILKDEYVEIDKSMVREGDIGVIKGISKNYFTHSFTVVKVLGVLMAREKWGDHPGPLVFNRVNTYPNPNTVYYRRKIK